MLELEAALNLVVEHSRLGGEETIPLADAVGRTIAGDVVSDIDSPPFDKSMMDGFAVRYDEFAAGQTEFPISGQQMAGDRPGPPLEPGTAVQIMTGAAIPDGADAVVMVEQTRTEANRVTIQADRIASGQNIMKRATALRAGAVIVPRGTSITSTGIGLLAEIGASEVSVYRRPNISILATGNELIPVSQKPVDGQIRNSNGPMLNAMVAAAGGIGRHDAVRDSEAELRDRIEAALKSDMVILSGGVSAGKMDLVPGVLESLGVRPIFHKVRLKPGKPVWFGVFETDANRCLVFGLPGNPLSSLVCFHLFVRTAMRGYMGLDPAIPDHFSARLQGDHRQRGDRPTYWPSRWEIAGGEARVTPMAWRGSADQNAMGAANGLVFFPTGVEQFQSGDLVQVLPFTAP